MVALYTYRTTGIAPGSLCTCTADASASGVRRVTRANFVNRASSRFAALNVFSCNWKTTQELTCYIRSWQRLRPLILLSVTPLL